MRWSARLPLNLSLRMQPLQPRWRWLIATALAVGVTSLALAVQVTPLLSIPLARLNNVLYDTLYNLRPFEDQTNGPVIIVAVDDRSLEAVNKAKVFTDPYGWPWPRYGWGKIAQYLGKCGAKAVAFDILFSEVSAHENDVGGDDEAFAQMLADAKAPVIFATAAQADGSPGPFAVPATQPHLGAVNVNETLGKSKIFREFTPRVYGYPSLALETLRATGIPVRLPEQPFMLHYYGPSELPEGKRTFTYISAANLLHASLKPANAQADGIDPEMFRGKIVLIGATTIGTYDMKATPLSDAVSGVEVQATAMLNLMNGQRVIRIPRAAEAGSTFLFSMLAAIGIIRPRSVGLKLSGALAALVILLTTAILLFVRHNIVYLPLAGPLLAGFLATIGGFAWSYLAEDRQRRMLLKALSRVVSPVIAEELSRDPDKLVLGGQRREMTVMFTDIAGFTELSEKIEADKLAPLLNYYLEQMSSMVFRADGTLDKYIGDAIMSFWNAPLAQPDHAHLACRAALGMARREKEIQEELRSLGAEKLYTRIGINSGSMAVGFTGSTHLFNYTVLGDSVNLGSRLEGANKIYGSQIMLSQSTAEFVKADFLLRKLDLLRVKGKQQPMGVYELIAEGPGEESDRRRARSYEEALSFYQRQRWDDAERIFLELAAEFPDDGPTAAIMARIRKYRHDPPPAEWDGVYVAKDK